MKAEAAPWLLPRDPATDQSRPVDWQTFEPVNPDGTLARFPLGGQVRTTSLRSKRTGRPSRFRVRPVLVQAVDPRVQVPRAISPGTIRRNVVWPTEEVGATGLFSAAANTHPEGHPRFFQVTGVAEYIISSLALQLSRPLSWVTAGAKPLLPDGTDAAVQVRRFRGFQQASGWPVVAPSVPSYGSRVPLLRPRGLVSNE